MIFSKKDILMIKKSTILGLIVLMLSGCEQKDENTIIFGEVTADKQVVLSNDEGSPQCTVHLRLAYATDENGQKAGIVNETIQRRFLDMHDLTMKQAADSFANSYAAAYKKNFLPLYNQDRADTTKRSWYEYHYVITSQTQPRSKGTTSYIATIDYFEGGTHGVNMQQTILFDNHDGRELTLDDLFERGYENPLTAILLKSLQEKLGAESTRDLNNLGYLVGMKLFPSKNFILNDETITFIYNPHEIAPYEKGSTELTVSLSELGDILKKEYQ